MITSKPRREWGTISSKLIFSYIKEHLRIICAYILFVIVYAVVFYLSGVDIEISLYPSIICFSLTIYFVSVSFYKYAKKHMELERRKNHVDIITQELFETENTIEADYTDLLMLQKDYYDDKINELNRQLSDLNEYITLWAHQIKTPITAMGLLLQEGSDEESVKLKRELFEIEHYVDTTLQYMRMDIMNADFVFKEYMLIDIVKKAVKYFSKIFISKRISLNLGETDACVVTDEKWLLFVIKQILSNALKYTDKGSISIYVMEQPVRSLVIEDTGIGLEPEDIPRIFEKGFTGYNGRMNKKSTGIGLYLTKKVIRKLNHNIRIESEPSVGTKVIIEFSDFKLS